MKPKRIHEIVFVRAPIFVKSIVASLILLMPVARLAGQHVETTTGLAPKGNGSIAYAPDCRQGRALVRSTLETDEDGYVISAASTLLYTERLPGQTDFGPQEIVIAEQPQEWTRPVALAYDALSRPHLFVGGGGTDHYVRDAAGIWVQVASPGLGSSSQLVARRAGQRFQLAGQSASSITYTTVDDAGILGPLETVKIFARPVRFTWLGVARIHQSQARNLDLAVGPDAAVHMTYSVDPVETSVSGDAEVRRYLSYATRAPGGIWQPGVIRRPDPDWGDAGATASIDVAMDGTVAIAASYLPRARTGSPGVCRHEYMVKQADGSWQTSTVANSSDNYRAGDGERGTGLHPQLRFGSAGDPRIVFTDHCSEHFPGMGALNESGQLRLATRANPRTGAWSLQTLVRRGGVRAYDFAILEPALATFRGETIVAAESFDFTGFPGRIIVRSHETTLGVLDLSGKPPAPSNPYETWIAEIGGDFQAVGMGFEEDPNHDGILNGIAWALGLASVTATGVLELLPKLPDRSRIVEFRAPLNRVQGARLTVESARHLNGPWTMVAEQDDSLPSKWSGSSLVSASASGDRRLVRVRLADGTSGFLRLRVRME